MNLPIYLSPFLLVVLSILIPTNKIWARSLQGSADAEFQLENDPYRSFDLESSSLDPALQHYYYMRKMLERFPYRADHTTQGARLQGPEKRAGYWKQCKFNAVSCFGRRKK